MHSISRPLAPETGKGPSTSELSRIWWLRGSRVPKFHGFWWLLRPQNLIIDVSTVSQCFTVQTVASFYGLQVSISRRFDTAGFHCSKVLRFGDCMVPELWGFDVLILWVWWYGSAMFRTDPVVEGSKSFISVCSRVQQFQFDLFWFWTVAICRRCTNKILPVDKTTPSYLKKSQNQTRCRHSIGETILARFCRRNSQILFYCCFQFPVLN